ncbi:MULTISPECIES: FeoC-like transcriptional regulator [Tenebrionibacter/Tenebrionicola group]|jgi:ferrous iron transport protein C|uniref:Ferrous iron transporter C n=2 Tax=Tenebrionibacter/Tenebrionicola group TaxID=2969848 RepID=A0A8K0XX21_9ENTR|nr:MULTISPECIES: FeoC-like transcriptional regulator [Tenebrionibacter/Tenebrionicola group]MBK4716115.1 ferrous iron transporter C [Tenebrionibacter intestinalis]MBV4413153.1 ferrous iron transporter C [Tenebrionicola larvae]MBV5095955.1 ferrous iron transporter C [Tenebrionicola larvae]
MAGLKEVRDLLALRGRLETQQISQLLATPLPRIEALLSHLERMKLAVRVSPASDDACFPGSCRRCPQRKSCLSEQWTLLS